MLIYVIQGKLALLEKKNKKNFIFFIILFLNVFMVLYYMNLLQCQVQAMKLKLQYYQHIFSVWLMMVSLVMFLLAAIPLTATTIFCVCLLVNIIVGFCFLIKLVFIQVKYLIDRLIYVQYQFCNIFS